MLLWTFDIRKSVDPDPLTGRAFEYHAGDAAFNGDVRASVHGHWVYQQLTT